MALTVLCDRIKKNGEQCRRPPVSGETSCFVHGGYAPSRKLHAERLLQAAARPAIGALLYALNDDNVFARIKAADSLLDRAGFARHKALEVTQKPPGNSLVELSRDELAVRVDRLRDKLFGPPDIELDETTAVVEEDPVDQALQSYEDLREEKDPELTSTINQSKKFVLDAQTKNLKARIEKLKDEEGTE